MRPLLVMAALAGALLATPAMAGLALTLVFVGGAAGKLACAHLGARFGIIGAVVLTEMLTAMGMAAIYVLPLAPTLVLLPFVGVVLNGTSSLTYGSVPQFVSPATRDRAFGIFYTGTIGSGALSADPMMTILTRNLVQLLETKRMAVPKLTFDVLTSVSRYRQFEKSARSIR